MNSSPTEINLIRYSLKRRNWFERGSPLLPSQPDCVFQHHVYHLIPNVKIHVGICNSAGSLNSFQDASVYFSAWGIKTCTVAWRNIVADKVEFEVSDWWIQVYFCLCIPLSTPSKTKSWTELLVFLFPPRPLSSYLVNLSSRIIFVPEVSKSPREEDKILLGQNVQVTL